MSVFTWGADGSDWIVPDGYTPDRGGQCRSCGASVLWCTTRRGRRAPLNADGTSHFANCPQAAAWRNAR